jgi:hypothetical protein
MYTKRVTANLPAELLTDAVKITGQNVTDTIVRGLELVRRSAAYDVAMKLKGKVQIELDISKARGRSRS